MNSVNLIGRLVKPNEPKQYNSQNGAGMVLKNTIALKGKKQDESYFIDFTAWGKTAEYLAKYTNKGDKIAIIGELIQESWQDQQSGQKRSKIVVNVKEAEVLVTAQNNQGQAQFNQQQAQFNQGQAQTQHWQNPDPNSAVMGVSVTNYAPQQQMSNQQQFNAPMSDNEIPF